MKRCLSWLFIFLYVLAALSPLTHRPGDAGLPGCSGGAEPHPGFLYLELILDHCLPEDGDEAAAPFVILKKKRAVLRQTAPGPVSGDDGPDCPGAHDSVPFAPLTVLISRTAAAFATGPLFPHVASGLSPPSFPS